MTYFPVFFMTELTCIRVQAVCNYVAAFEQEWHFTVVLAALEDVNNKSKVMERGRN